MIAAIYARKSTKQLGVAEEHRSVERQIENARVFAAAKGWEVRDEYIFKDDGISGAEFTKRPGLKRLMDLAFVSRPPFSVLIVSEQKSIGREMAETGYIIKQLAQAGIEIFEYVHGESLTPRTPMHKLLSSVQGYADEDHQRKTSERNREKTNQQVKSGHVAGGRVFGYRNVHVYNGTDAHGNSKRSHTLREIDPIQAAVVRRIFELYDSGVGGKAIAKRLNQEGAPSPIPFKRKDGLPSLSGWAPETIRAILRRDLYRGVVVWNKERKRDEWGKVNWQKRQPSEWLRMPVDEALRIVPEELWNRVAARRSDTEGRTLRFADGRMSGRPPKHDTKNLLAGLAQCALCGGAIVVETSPRRQGRVPEYVCKHHGSGRCANRQHVVVAEVNEAVLQAIEEHALTPEAIEQVVQLTERDDHRERQALLERERKDLKQRIERVMAVIESGEAAGLTSLVAKMRELEARLAVIDDEVKCLQPVPRLDPVVLENRLAEWRRLLRSSITQGRAVLQRIVRGRIVFTPTEYGFEFEAPTRFDKLFSGVASPRPKFIKPGDLTGTKNIGPEDTPDGDYGRLLERAYGRGKQRVTSPTGFEPVFWP